MSRRRLLTILAVGAVILVAAFFVLNRGRETPTTVEGERLPAERGTITATVNATGNVEANRQVSLSFRSTGRVAELLVEEGDAVEAGQPLARLETTDLVFAVAQAEASVAAQQAQLAKLQAAASEDDIQAAEAQLASAQANLERLQSGTDPEEIRAAEAQLASARANLANLQQGADADDVEAARASLAAAEAALARLDAGPDEADLIAAAAELERARAALQQAQAAYDQVAYRADIGALPQSRDLQQATINYEQAQANYDRVAAGPTADQLEQARANVSSARAQLNQLLDGTDQAQISAAQAQVVQAETTLNQLLEGADAADLRAAEAQVEQAEASLAQLREGADEADLAVARANLRQAELSLEQAEENLAGAEIEAPFDGTVATIAAQEGELVPSAQPMVTLVDLSTLQIEVEVDEVDVGQVRVSDPVTVFVDSLPDVEIPGEIDYIAPVPAIEQGVVTYPVRVRLDPDAAPGLRVGMSANVDITTETREDVLLVPTRAVEIDRTTGQLFVEKLVNGEPVRTEVTVGLRDDSMSEITSGLEAGDVILIRTIDSQERLRQGLSGG